MTISIEYNCCHKRFAVIVYTIAVCVSVNAIGCTCKRDLKRAIYRCSCVLGSLDKSCPAVLRRFINDIVTVKVTKSGITGYGAKVRAYSSTTIVTLINTINDTLTCITGRKIVSRRSSYFLYNISAKRRLFTCAGIVSPVIALSAGNCICL